MQLLLVLLFAFMGGNVSALKEVKPVLESLGGKDAVEALSKAEELSGVINAVQAMAGMNATRANPSHGGSGGKSGENSDFSQHGFPLAPITNIADENITYCLSRYIALGA